MDRRSSLAVVTVAVLALAVGAWLGARHRTSAPWNVTTVFAAPRPLPAFELHAGDRTVDAATLRGHWSVLYFGYTACPDVCPTTLATLARVDRSLADLDDALRPRVLFVSVDPTRDTPQVADDYARYYDPRFTGASAPEAALAPLTTALGAAHQIVPDGRGSYAVDHSAALFVVDPTVHYVAVITPPFTDAQLATDLRRLVTTARG